MRKSVSAAIKIAIIVVVVFIAAAVMTGHAKQTKAITVSVLCSDACELEELTLKYEEVISANFNGHTFALASFERTRTIPKNSKNYFVTTVNWKDKETQYSLITEAGTANEKVHTFNIAADENTTEICAFLSMHSDGYRFTNWEYY